MQSLSSKENFFIGFSLSNSSNYDSSVCVLDRNSNIVLMDKFYFAQDINYFFETSPYLASCVLCVSVAYDNKMLEGKWRIHSKNYKVLSDKFKINRDDWTNRISKRCSETFKKLKEEKNIKVIRCDINQLRQAYGLYSDYLNRTSIYCKTLQTSLKIKFGFNQLPDNMLPASSLESIMCAMFAMEYVNDIEAKEIFDIDGIPVLARKMG